jgi:hypothetical protein
MNAFWHRYVLRQNWHTLIAWLPTLTWLVIAAILHNISVGRYGSPAGQNFFYYSKWFLLGLLLIAIVSAVRRKLTAIGWIGMIPSTILTLIHVALLID